MKRYKATAVLLILLTCSYMVIVDKIRMNNPVEDAECISPSATSSSLASMSRNRIEKNIKYSTKNVSLNNQSIIEELFEKRNMRRIANGDIIVTDDWLLKSDFLLTRGYSKSDVEIIKNAINTFSHETASTIASHTILIDEDFKKYRIEKYNHEFKKHLDKLITSLNSKFADYQVNYLVSALPLENYIGFSGKFAVDLKIIEKNSQDNLYDETCVFYKSETDHPDSFESGHKRGRFISSMMGGIAITDQGIMLSKD